VIKANVKENIMSVPVLRRIAATSLVSLVLAYSGGAVAACKGMAEPACTAEAACAWVAGYERKDGIEVKGYCRTKPVRSGKHDEQSAVVPAPGVEIAVNR
jgi:hypothetical protein